MSGTALQEREKQRNLQTKRSQQGFQQGWSTNSCENRPKQKITNALNNAAFI